MAETIGRVEFLASLNGRSLPREAKELGRKIGEAGDQAGEDYGDGFQSGFDRKLSAFGKELSESLERDGKRAGESFGDSLDATLQTRFRRMQSNLADILTDEDTFAGFTKGFGSVSEAIDRANADLDELARSTYMMRDEEGKLREELVLTSEEYERASAEISRLGEATQKQVDRDAQLSDAQRKLARETDELNAQWTRLTRLVGDSDSFGQAAERMGGISAAHRKLRMEIEEGGLALGRTRAEIDGYVDRLDLTRDRALNLAASVAVVEREHRTFGETVRGLSGIISKPWQNLDNDVRLVVTLIASAADQIAALGSAAGAGLLSVGGTIGALGVGLSGVIPVFLALNREAELLPENMRDVANEFQAFKRGFSETASVISGSAFDQLPGTFSSLESSLRVLDPAFAQLGDVVGNLASDFARGLAPGTEGLEELNTFIGDSTGLFDSLARSAGTLGGALIRSFNRAVPLTEDFVGWVDKLVDRFDDFSRSTEFDAWVRNAQVIWGDFGELLDATGEALGDLANPSATANLRGFMDDLTEFMPKLATGLNVIGELNILGLLAQTLNDIGGALEPLGPPLYDLAGALSDIASIAIGELAEALGVIATAVAPAVQGLADFLDALPPEAIEAAADAVILFGGAFLFLKGTAAIASTATAVGLFGTAATAAGDAAKGMSGKLSGIAGKAGVWGLVAVGAFAAGEAIQDFIRDLEGIDDITADAVANGSSLQSTYEQVGFAFSSASSPVDFLSIALRNLSGTTGGFVSDADDVIARMGDFGNVFTRSFAGFDAVGQDAIALSNTLKELDGPISDLASTDLSAATSQFAAYAGEVGASKDQVLIMLNEMPAFKDALISAAEAEDGLATDADLVALALTGATDSSKSTRDALAELEGKSAETGEAIDGLADKIRNFGSATLTTRDAERQFEDAIDAASASLTENGNSLDITDEKGRKNQATLDDIAKSALDFAGATYEQTGSLDGASAAIDRGRTALINQMKQFGYTEAEANAYADELGLIPDNVKTLVKTPGLDTALDGARKMNDAVRRVPTTWNTEFTTSGKTQGPVFPRTATGGLFHGAQTRVIGEAGAEAVVPLNRPLNQVDPAVRALSAFAQGKAGWAGGGVAGGGNVNNFMPGSIVVNGGDDPRATALEVVDAIAELVRS